MKRISLTQGQFATVDDEDFEWLNQWTWYAVRRGRGLYYVKRSHSLGNGEYTEICMDRQILGLEYRDGRRVKYINKDTFDNRKNNLKIVTMMSSKEKDIFHSKYLG
jgi:hypothetical protein